MLPGSTDLQPVGFATGPRHAPRRPLPALALCWMGGLAAGTLWPIREVWVIAWMTAFLLSVLAIVFSRRSGSIVLIYAALLLSSMLVMSIARGHGDPRHVRNVLARDGQFVVVTGLVKSGPLVESSGNPDRARVIFELNVDAIGAGPEAQPARGRASVYISGSPDSPAFSIRAGDRVQVSGAYRPEERSLIESRGRDGSVRAAASQVQVLERAAGNPLVMLCLHARDRAARVLGWGMPDGDASVTMARALLLGLRSDIDRKVNDAFARTGTLHILSLSGTHVAILVMIMVVLLKSAGIPRPLWVVYFLPVLLIYTIGTGGMASTVRASLMAIVFFLAYFLRRRPDAASSLAFAAILILAADPLQLFDMGFILSFVIVAGLIGLYRPVLELFPGYNLHASTTGETAGRFAVVRSAFRKVAESLAVSIAAWLVSLPLIVNLFHLVSPIALLVNLVLIPLTFVILLTACLSIASGIFSVHLASLFNHANWLFNDWLLGLVDHSAGWPGSYYYVRAWPWSLVVAWYALLLIFVTGRKTVRWSVLAILVAMAGYSINERSWSSRMEISVIPSGSSVSMLVDGPGDHAILVDTGSRFRSRSLIDYVRARGINHIDEVWVSRANADAYGGLFDLAESVSLGAVRGPEVGKAQPVFLRMIEQVAATGVTVGSWSAKRLHERGDLILRLLHPESGDLYKNAGTSALAVQIAHRSQSLVFMGMSDPRIEQTLLKKPAEYGGATLILGALSGPEAPTMEWMDRIRCRTIVLPDELFDDARVGSSGLLERLRARAGLEIIQLDERDAYRFEL